MAFASPSRVVTLSESFNVPYSAKSKENASTQPQQQQQPQPLPSPTQLLKSPGRAKLQPTSPSVHAQLKKLEQKRDQLEDEGRYLEAQIVHDQLVKLKISEEARKRDTVRVSKQTQLKTLEEIYEEELHLVRVHFEKELKEFERRVEQGLAEMQERHEKALAEYRAKAKVSMEEVLSTKCPPSKRLLEMRQAEKALAKQREYRQANDMKIAADALERQEHGDRCDRARHAIHTGEERLKERLRNELAVFDQRNGAIRATLLENRRFEEDTVKHRYQNKKNDMLSSATRVEGAIERKIEHMSPSKPTNRHRIAGGNQNTNVLALD